MTNRFILRKMKVAAAICLAAMMTGCNTTHDTEQLVNELYDKMSQEERIAQLRSMYMDELFDKQ